MNGEYVYLNGTENAVWFKKKGTGKLNSKCKRNVIIAPTGSSKFHPTEKNHKLLKNHDMYIMESNHDIELLMDSSYPYYLKQRILGDSGHLSNEDSAKYLNKFIGTSTKTVILIHLSEQCNNAEVALNEHLKYETNLNYIVSKPKESTGLIEL
jgi:phosphoribosyl 1,2-cyclic phosphodiesterase